MHVLVVIDLTGAQKLPANTNTAILWGAMRDKRRAELDHKRRAELYHKRRAELDQKRATSLVALKAGVPTTDVAERQIDVAERQTDVAERQIDVAERQIDVAERQIDEAERQIDEAERQIDVAGVFICGNHSSTQYPHCSTLHLLLIAVATTHRRSTRRAQCDGAQRPSPERPRARMARGRVHYHGPQRSKGAARRSSKRASSHRPCRRPWRSRTTCATGSRASTAGGSRWLSLDQGHRNGRAVSMAIFQSDGAQGVDSSTSYAIVPRCR